MPDKIQLSDLRLEPFDPQSHNVANFDCGDSDLNEFLQRDAHQYQQAHVSFTRVVYYGQELVAYITLLADCIILKTPEKKKLVGFHQQVMQWPAVKIGRLAVCTTRQKKSGIGHALLQYSVGVAVRLGRENGIGCRFITVDAYPESIEFYERHGFIFNKHYVQRPKNPSRLSWIWLNFLRRADPAHHPSMRYDILTGTKI